MATATFSSLAVRDDFRCSLCRQKSAFHCEHDTPYRDQILGTYDQEEQYVRTTNSGKASHRTGSHNNKNSTTTSNQMHHTNTGKASHQTGSHHNKNSTTTSNQMQHTNTEKNTNSKAGAQYQQVKRPEHNTLSNTNPNGSIKKHEQKKKNKSCVIL
jgi:hypothetical protein